MNQDDRKHRRYPARMPMVLEQGSTRAVVESEDISLSGLCVRSEVPVDVYSIVYLTLPMPSEAPIHLTGMVVHNGGPTPRGEARPIRIQLHFFANYPAERWEWLVSTIDWRSALTRPMPGHPLPDLPRAN